MAKDIVKMEGVTIVLRNFQGKARKYNKPGDRNFGVLLSPEVAQAMLEDDWNVKFFTKREDDDPETPPQAWLPVAVDFERYKPPGIFIVTSRGRTQLDEETCKQLDGVDLKNVDLIVRPFNWSVDGKSGVKAYLQKMYATIEEDDLDKKYAHLETQYVAEDIYEGDDE